jgi:hypothetical protein
VKQKDSMRFWFLLVAIALMQLTCNAKPYEKKNTSYAYKEKELKELLSKMPDDFDGAELLRRLQSIMGQEVRNIVQIVRKLRHANRHATLFVTIFCI